MSRDKKLIPPNPNYMSIDITSALVPLREDGQQDQRFLSIVAAAIAEQSQETIYYLAEAKQASNDHQRKYYPYVRDVVLSILKKSAEANLDGCYRKHIREIVGQFGYPTDSATRVVGALNLIHESALTKADTTEWYKELPVRAAYALSKCSDEGRVKAWIESNWGADPFTVRQAETIASRYPKPALFGRGTGSGRRSKEQKPFITSDANKAHIDALSAASPVTTQGYAAPTPKTEEPTASHVAVVDTQVIEAVAVSVVGTTVEEAKPIASLLPAIDENFYLAFEGAVLSMDKLSAAEKAVVHQIGSLAASYNLGRAFRR